MCFFFVRVHVFMVCRSSYRDCEGVLPPAATEYGARVASSVAAARRRAEGVAGGAPDPPMAVPAMPTLSLAGVSKRDQARLPRPDSIAFSIG